MLFKPEYLKERIDHHRERVQAHVLAADRASQGQTEETEAHFLKVAARHASIFTALSAIADGK